MFLAIIFENIFLLFITPTLSPYFKRTFHTTDAFTHICFLFSIGPDAIACPLMGWLNTKVDPLKMVGFGLFLNPIGLLLLGPSLALGFPEEIGLVIAGLCIQGFS